MQVFALFVAVAVFILTGGGVLLAEEVAAFTPAEVSFSPLIDFGSLFTSLLTAVAPIVAGAIGVGLAIWGTRWLYQRAKSLAR
jgi:hypothetical protein